MGEGPPARNCTLSVSRSSKFGSPKLILFGVSHGRRPGHGKVKVAQSRRLFWVSALKASHESNSTVQSSLSNERNHEMPFRLTAPMSRTGQACSWSAIWPPPWWLAGAALCRNPGARYTAQ